MRAIVLSFDRHAGFVELVHRSYSLQWPDCPLFFRVPVNDPTSHPALGYLRGQRNVEIVLSPSPIKKTMECLLGGLGDDEWVYWCIDDRYPHQILDLAAVNAIHAAIQRHDLDEFNAIRLFRWKEEVLEETVEIAGIEFNYMNPASTYGFWHHHFCRSHVLRSMFLDPPLREGYGIDELNGLLQNIGHIAALEKTVVPARNIIRFDEPCFNGMLTPNGLADLRRFGCHVPPYRIAKHERRFFDNRTPLRGPFPDRGSPDSRAGSIRSDVQGDCA